MGNAIARLAAELMKLPAEEWTRLDARRLADQRRDTVLVEAGESEVAERLRETELSEARSSSATRRLSAWVRKRKADH